jgi:hypothetical protein
MCLSKMHVQPERCPVWEEEAGSKAGAHGATHEGGSTGEEADREPLTLVLVADDAEDVHLQIPMGDVDSVEDVLQVTDL